MSKKLKDIQTTALSDRKNPDITHGQFLFLLRECVLNLQEQIKVLNKRIIDLERKNGLGDHV